MFTPLEPARTAVMVPAETLKFPPFAVRVPLESTPPVKAEMVLVRDLAPRSSSPPEMEMAPVPSAPLPESRKVPAETVVPPE